jgi:cytochrome b-561
LHCFVLPTSVLLLFSWHMWRVRKDGGLAAVDREARKEKEKKSTSIKSKTYSLLGITSGRTVAVETSYVDQDENLIESSPNLTRRLLFVTLSTILISIALAFLVQAPLEEAANPLVTPNPAKAPWYFLWLQELVTDTTIHIGTFTISGALVGGIILPGVLGLILAAWPYLDRSSASATGVWFARERRRQNIAFLAVVFVILVLTFVGTFMRGPSWHLYWPWEQWPPTPTRF